MQSEVAQLREKIRLEYESAERGLHGLSGGSARHAFISAKYDRIGVLHGELQRLVGETEALQMVIDATMGLGNELNQRTQVTSS